MILLEGILAFALTLVALSTAVTAIVEAVQRGVRSRPAGLLRVMVHFYEAELRKTLKEDLAELMETPDASKPDTTTGKESLTSFLNRMILYPDARAIDFEGLRKSFGSLRPKGLMARIRLRIRLWQPLQKVADKLSDEQFIERFRGTRIGKAIEDQIVEGKEPEVYATLQKCFRALGEAASEAFARRARGYTVLAGLLLAFAANIDALHLLNSYLTDRELRLAVIGRQEAILAEAVREETETPSSEPYEALLSALEITRSQLDDINNQGFPIGWNRYPGCSEQAASSLDPRCRSADALTFLQWLLGVLLTGFLIGLGSPFWFEVVQKLMRARETVAKSPGKP